MAKETDAKSSTDSETQEYLTDGNSSVSSATTISEEAQTQTQVNNTSEEERNSKKQLQRYLEQNNNTGYKDFKEAKFINSRLDILEWMISQIGPQPKNAFRLVYPKNYEINKQHPLEYAVNKGYRIHEQDPISWAVSKGVQIYGQDPILWAVEKNKTIDGQDPIAWAAKKSKSVFVSDKDNYLNKNRQDPIAWAVSKGQRIEGKDPIIWAIENDKKIGRRDPISWAIEENKTIEGQDPITWAITKNKKVEEQDPLTWAVTNNKKIEEQDPIKFFTTRHAHTWEQLKNSKTTPHPLAEIVKHSIDQYVFIDDIDPIEFAQQLGIKIEGKSAMQYAVDNSIEIYDELSKSKVNPIIFAKNNNYQIDGKDPILYAEESGLEIEGKKPINWAIENNRKVRVTKVNEEGVVIDSKNVEAKENKLIQKPKEQSKLEKIKEKVNGILKHDGKKTSTKGKGDKQPLKPTSLTIRR